MKTALFTWALNLLLVVTEPICSPMGEYFSTVPEYDGKKITQSLMWTLNLDKGQCILKCLVMEYCLGVQVLPSVPTCFGIRERFESSAAPTVPEEGIVMYRPIKPYQVLGSRCELDVDCIEIPNSACQDGTCDCDDLSALNGDVCEIITTTTTTTTTPEPICVNSPPEEYHASASVGGFVATYNCHPGYYSDTQMQSTCQQSGNWSAPTSVCHPPNEITPSTTSYTLSMLGGTDFAIEMRVIQGSIGALVVNILGSNTNDILMHLSIRIPAKVVVNSKVGSWGTEGSFNFPRTAGVHYLLTISYTAGSYRVQFDDEVKLADWPERYPTKKPRNLQVQGIHTTVYVGHVP